MIQALHEKGKLQGLDVSRILSSSDGAPATGIGKADSDGRELADRIDVDRLFGSLPLSFSSNAPESATADRKSRSKSEGGTPPSPGKKGNVTLQ